MTEPQVALTVAMVAGLWALAAALFSAVIGPFIVRRYERRLEETRHRRLALAGLESIMLYAAAARARTSDEDLQKRLSDRCAATLSQVLVDVAQGGLPIPNLSDAGASVAHWLSLAPLVRSRPDAAQEASDLLATLMEQAAKAGAETL